MRFSSYVASIVIAAIAATVLFIPAAQAEVSCPGRGCTGLNPTDTSCVNDARTIGAIDVGGNGMLELRWSRSCNAGWARFTTYRRAEIFGTLTGTAITHVRVVAWGEQGVQENGGAIMQSFAGYTVWSKMSSFEQPVVCTGVELFSGADLVRGSTVSGPVSEGWWDGPCAT